MIISQIGGGVGNQLFRYAAGRRLAHKWNTEFKLDISEYEKLKWPHYDLGALNVIENFATPEEIARLKKFREGTNLGKEKRAWHFWPEVLDYPDDLYVSGAWEDERYFADISDIIRQEFTFKKALGTAAQDWKVKILAAENSVSLHFRHGDFVTNPLLWHSPSNAILPLDYYYTCVNILKEQYQNLTLFIFSNNLQWVKENLRAGVPMEFVEGEDLQDIEELYLMSLCKHNIIAASTFSWWGAWLNQNPDKKVFMPIPNSNAAKNVYRYSAEQNENSPLDSDRWIRIPFDLSNQQSVTIRPWFSLLLVVNNDIDTLVESLNSIIGQDYKYFELIIIDNASTDDSWKICQQVKTFDNIMLIKLHDKVQNGAAWNIALKAAQGYYVMFLKGNDRLLANALTSLYLVNESFADVVNSVIHLKEDGLGNVDISGKKFVIKKMSAFQNLDGIFRDKLDKSTLLKVLSNDEILFPIETRIFSRKFLEKNKIRFNEKIGDDAENLFIIDALFQTEEIIFTPNIFYIAP